MSVNTGTPGALLLDLQPPEKIAGPLDAETIRLLATLDDADRLAGLLRQAQAAGFGGVLCPYSAEALAALRALGDERTLEVYPVVPNASQYVREISRHGMMGAAVNRLKRLGPGQMVRIGLRGVRNVRSAMKRNLAAIVAVMIEIEIGEFKPFQPPAILLHPQMTDLALAAGNEKFFRKYATLIRDGFSTQPGLATRNLGALLQSLKAWGVDVPVVAGPFNKKGYRMRPSPQITEELVREGGWHVLALDVGAGGSLSRDEALNYAWQMGAAGAVLDLRALGEVYR
jgi:hypothetical protein